MPDLDLDLLRAFVAVADAGTFTAAADVVGRSQSAVSQKIRRLEELIRQPVFDRTSRSLSLTGPGGQLLVGARRMLASMTMSCARLSCRDRRVAYGWEFARTSCLYSYRGSWRASSVCTRRCSWM